MEYLAFIILIIFINLLFIKKKFLTNQTGLAHQLRKKQCHLQVEFFFVIINLLIFRQR